MTEKQQGSLTKFKFAMPLTLAIATVIAIGVFEGIDRPFARITDEFGFLAAVLIIINAIGCYRLKIGTENENVLRMIAYPSKAIIVLPMLLLFSRDIFSAIVASLNMLVCVYVSSKIVRLIFGEPDARKNTA